MACWWLHSYAVVCDSSQSNQSWCFLVWKQPKLRSHYTKKCMTDWTENYHRPQRRNVVGGSKLHTFQGSRKICSCAEHVNYEWHVTYHLNCVKGHYPPANHPAGTWAITKVSGHQYQWLAGGYDLETRLF